MIGETIGNFRIVSRLGRGGMGEVWLAEQQNIGTRVAVKLLLPEISDDAEHVQRFFNEARAVSRIQHAGIVKIFDVGHHPSGHAYLVMEYLEGETLGQRIRRAGRLTAPEIAELGRQIASVLDATHSAGIIHRDLKPDNVFIVPDHELASRQRVKVLDFGIAKLSGTLAHISPRTIGTMGTPAYMAPEQWGDASRVDWRADVYSLGCVAFEMTCGRPPFVVTTMAEACGKHLTEPPPRARSLADDVPPELDELLAACLEKRPDDRPQSMAVVLRRFEVLAERVGPPPPTTIPLPRNTPDASASTQLPSQRDPGATVATEPPAPRREPARLAHREPWRAWRAPWRAWRAQRPTPRSKRLPLVLGGAVLVAGGVAAGVLVRGSDAPGSASGRPTASTASTASTAERWSGCREPLVPPDLVGRSEGPVQLAYLLPNQKRTAVTTELRLETRARIGATHHADDTSVRFDGTLTWALALADNHTAVMLARQLRVDRRQLDERPGAAPQHTTIRWRSDDPASPRDFEPLRAALKNGVSITIDPRGGFVRGEVSRLHAAIVDAGGTPAMTKAITTERLFQPMFIELPPGPIQLGDTFAGGDQLERLWWGADVVAPFALRVTAIAGGGKQVLLEAGPELSVDLAGSITNLDKEATLQMWVVFDVERGEVASSATRACVRVTMQRDGEPVEASAVMSSAYQSRPVSPGVAARPVAPPAADPRAPAEAAPTVQGRGEMPAASIRTTIRRISPELRRCARSGKLVRITAKFTINTSGLVERLRLSAGDAATTSCVREVLQRTQFGNPKGASVEVSLPLTLLGSS